MPNDLANSARVLVASASAEQRALISEVVKAAGLRAVGFVREPDQLLRRVQLSAPDVLLVDRPMHQTVRAELGELRKSTGPLRILLCASSSQGTLDRDGLHGTLEAGAPAEAASRLRQMLAAEPAAPAPRAAIGSPTTAPARRRILAPECLVIGSSTGGPIALMQVLKALPANFPLPVALVQHMPPGFTRMLAERLDAECPLHVTEAEQGMPLAAGTALIAPGGFHLKLTGNARNPTAELSCEEPENSCRPAVDVLFRSSAAVFGGRQMALVLTGMGRDGLAGATLLHGLGARVLVQDSATSTVWGMPGAIAQAGLADDVLPIDHIASYLMRCL